MLTKVDDSRLSDQTSAEKNICLKALACDRSYSMYDPTTLSYLTDMRLGPWEVQCTPPKASDRQLDGFAEMR